MAPEYRQTSDKKIQDRVRRKYKASIDQLKALNFEELCFYSESMPALGLSSGLMGVLGVIAGMPREVSKIEKDLSANVFFLLLVSREYDTYVSPFGLGVKFCTSFTDGTCVITANYDSPAINDDDEKLYKYAQSCSIQTAWKRHQIRVSKLTSSGRQRNYHLSFENFANLAHKEDVYLLKPKQLATVVSGGTNFLTTTIAAIIFGSLLAAVTFLFLILPLIVRSLYPACWFVRNVGRPSLPQSLLILFACIAFSWFLGRIQKGVFLVDGVGTMFRGQIPLPDARGYISTKWLVFIYLPILPIQSYQILKEVSLAGDQKPPSLQPLPQFHWAQIKETIWQFKWWYLIIVLLWVAMGVWTFYRCI